MNRFFSIIVFLLLFLNVQGQENGFGVQLNGEYGFETHSLYLNEYEVSEISTFGSSFLINYYRSIFTPNLTFNAGLGFRYYSMHASTLTSELSGEVVQPILVTGLGYLWLEKYQFQIGLKATNNEDFSDFTNEMSDLLRYNYMLNYQFHFNKKWSGILGYEGIIYPNKDLYRVENPGHLISCGIQYKL